MTTERFRNTVTSGDNLEALRSLDTDSVDMIYLDPPFNSGQLWSGVEHDGQFEDRWSGKDVDDESLAAIERHDADLAAFMDLTGRLHSGGMKAYLIMLTLRFIEMERILKPAGALYVHCDDTAGDYIRVALDGVMGAKKRRNQIVWKRSSGTATARKFARVHDLIYFYAGDGFTWNDIKLPLTPQQIEASYRHEDEHGRYALIYPTCRGAINGPSGQPWRGYKPFDGQGHWAVPRYLPRHFKKPDNWKDLKTQEKLDIMDEQGLMDLTGPIPRYKKYLDDQCGIRLQDVITDIGVLKDQTEKTGYPTQKPLALLARLIESSTMRGELVLDPFCGAGTTCLAAKELERDWIGLDLSPIATDTAAGRIHDLLI